MAIKNENSRLLVGRMEDIKPRTKKPSRPQVDKPCGGIELQLAIAHWIDRQLVSGEIEDRGAVARLLGISVPRVSQLLDLLLLSPTIQDAICTTAAETIRVGAHSVRRITKTKHWEFQELIWRGPGR